MISCKDVFSPYVQKNGGLPVDSLGKNPGSVEESFSQKCARVWREIQEQEEAQAGLGAEVTQVRKKIPEYKQARLDAESTKAFCGDRICGDRLRALIEEWGLDFFHIIVMLERTPSLSSVEGKLFIQECMQIWQEIQEQGRGLAGSTRAKAPARLGAEKLLDQYNLEPLRSSVVQLAVSMWWAKNSILVRKTFRGDDSDVSDLTVFQDQINVELEKLRKKVQSLGKEAHRTVLYAVINAATAYMDSNEDLTKISDVEGKMLAAARSTLKALEAKKWANYIVTAKWLKDQKEQFPEDISLDIQIREAQSTIDKKLEKSKAIAQVLEKKAQKIANPFDATYTELTNLRKYVIDMDAKVLAVRDLAYSRLPNNNLTLEEIAHQLTKSS